ncbi:hypothetical protein EOPP23_06065 [Endozoicomonas sp. OPT23]|uniref:hypothetical protein n=1 Tax=Endozoicomonas sp. OPT23 TaxID=2072845 RepID=UPI00129B802D|nr:hypothetical protein [Endozoicomonas sp. OPT23]MRI32550.1 hypothetical protein [Endozoicomonas sp. OPT23]
MPLGPTDQPAFNSSGRVAPRHKETPSLGEIDYGRWGGRVVGLFKGIARLAKRVLGSGPSAREALSFYERVCQKGHSSSDSAVQRSLNDYRIACVMAYHDVCKLGEELKNGKMEVVLSGGTRAIDEKLLGEVEDTASCTSVGLAYKFLAHDRRLPVGFLESALVPDLIQLAVNEYGASADDVERAVRGLLLEKSVGREKDVTFERLVDIKNALRWQFSTEGSQPLPPIEQTLGETAGLNPPAPVLEKPKATKYQLDHEDKEYIQTVVDSGGGVKLSKNDLKNRLKRYVLRNKKDIVLNTFAMIVSAVMTGLVSGGIGSAMTIFTYIAWTGAWSGGTEMIRMAKAIRALQQAESSRDYNFEVSDLGVISELDEKRFRTFLKSLRYICSHETLTRIFNSYSELELDAEARVKMKEDESCLETVIKLEEGKARYLYRRNNLKEAFHIYKRFYTAAVEDVSRMDREWTGKVDHLWTSVFEKMPEAQRIKVFNRAANDPRVLGTRYHFQTNKSEWLQDVFPKLSSKQKQGEASEASYEELERILEEEMPDVKLTEDEKGRFNKQASNVANAFTLVKSGLGCYLKSWIKGAVKATTVHGLKVGWHGITGLPKLEISPYLPKPSVDGVIVFGFFFLAELLVNNWNDRLNEYRMDKITGKRSGKSKTFSWLRWRERTGREEMNTMRKQSKAGLENFAESILKLHDHHKDVMEKLRIQEQVGQYVDEYELAVQVLRWQYNRQLIEQMTAGAIGSYYRSVISKTEFWDRQLAGVIPPQSPL